MITVVFNQADEVIAVTENVGSASDTPGAAYTVDRRDIPSLYAAVHLANRVSEFTGEKYFAVDSGAHVLARGFLPQYDIAKMPVVGEEVSRAFNGDYYPAGEIVSITPRCGRIVTSDGTVFTRRKRGATAVEHSARWLVRGSDAFTMVRGRINRRNPSF